MSMSGDFWTIANHHAFALAATISQKLNRRGYKNVRGRQMVHGPWPLVAPTRLFAADHRDLQGPAAARALIPLFGYFAILPGGDGTQRR